VRNLHIENVEILSFLNVLNETVSHGIIIEQMPQSFWIRREHMLL